MIFRFLTYHLFPFRSNSLCEYIRCTNRYFFILVDIFAKMRTVFECNGAQSSDQRSISDSLFSEETRIFFFWRTNKNKGIFKSLVCFRRIPNNYEFKFENKLAYFGRLENGDRAFQSQEPGRISDYI